MAAPQTYANFPTHQLRNMLGMTQHAIVGGGYDFPYAPTLEELHAKVAAIQSELNRRACLPAEQQACMEGARGTPTHRKER